MTKKSQVAMESLMVYGIAILIVMLAIGALIYFGVLDLGSFLPDKCDVKGGAISCENYVVKWVSSGTGEVDIELRNKLGKTIENVAVSIIGEDDMQGVFDCPASGTPIAVQYNSGATIPNGELSDQTTLPCNLGINPGKKVKGRIVVTYNVVGSQIARTEQGTIQATVTQ
jgi:hypothetical protein